MSRLRAVAIIRMSTDQQQFSPDRQRSMFAEYCQRWDLEAVGEYADEGVSATHTTLSRRAGLMQLVEDAKAGGLRRIGVCHTVARQGVSGACGAGSGKRDAPA